MKFSRRVLFAIIFGSIIVITGMIFWSFILEEIITPIALVAWLFLRIFVLSIGQKYYWGVIVLVAIVFLIRLLPKEEISNTTWDDIDSNDTLKTIRYWYSLFALTNYENRSDKSLKRELIRLIISFYASQQSASDNFRLYDALNRGEIPIPADIHTFLFDDEPEKTGQPLKKFLLSVQNAPRKWVRKWTGQEKAEYYHKLNAVLSFLETSLEIKNDDGKYTSIQH